MSAAHLRAGRPATVAEMAAIGASDRALADKVTCTVARLREAYATLGADRLEAVLGTLSQASLRAVLARLDAGRPGISRQRRPELLCVLREIAAGGNTFAEADALQAAPLGIVRFDMSEAFPGFEPPPAGRHEASMTRARAQLAGLGALFDAVKP